MYSAARMTDVRIFLVISTPTQVARECLCGFLTGRIRVLFEQRDGAHNEPRHAEGALKALLIDNRLLHRVQRAIRLLQPLDRRELATTNIVGQYRA